MFCIINSKSDRHAAGQALYFMCGVPLSLSNSVSLGSFYATNAPSLLFFINHSLAAAVIENEKLDDKPVLQERTKDSRLKKMSSFFYIFPHFDKIFMTAISAPHKLASGLL